MPGRLPRGPRGRRFGHRLHRHLDAQVQLLLRRPRRRSSPRASGPTRKRADLLQRVLRRAQARCAGSRRRRRRQRLQALQRQRQVRAALGRAPPRGSHPRSPPPRPISVSARLRGQQQVQRLRRRDQDVRRVAQHRRALALGRVAGADAHAHAHVALGRARDARAAGARRLRSMSYASAFSGLTYTTRVPTRPRRRRLRADPRALADPRPRRSPLRRSSAHRNAASVLPEPVGADTSTCSPRAIAGHACAWAGVGAANACSNHSRVRGLKLERGIPNDDSRPGCLRPIPRAAASTQAKYRTPAQVASQPCAQRR